MPGAALDPGAADGGAAATLEQPRSRRRAIVYAALACLLGVAGLAMVLVGLFGGAESAGERRRPDGRRRGRWSSSASRCSARAWCGRWPRSPGGRWSGCGGLIGRLARENTQRNPARTAVTAAALMIGLALVTFVTVFAAGIKSSISSAVDDNFQGELVIQNTDGFSPIPPTRRAPPRARCPASRWSRPCAAAQAKVLDGDGGKPRVSALDPATPTGC